MKNVKEIMLDYLAKTHSDGLCNVDGECGCGTDDLMPCENCTHDCEPAIKLGDGFWSKLVLRTSEKWAMICEDKIYDPDGWDRKNFDFSFKQEKISFEEYQNRLMRSTIVMSPKTVARLKAIQPQNRLDH